MDADHARGLWDWYLSGGFASIAQWLHSRDVSQFNPSATPMLTEFKATMIENGRAPVEEYLIDLMTREIGEFSCGFIGSPFHRLRDRLAATAPVGLRIPQAALIHALHESGWRSLGRVSSSNYNSSKEIYASPRILGKLTTKVISKSYIRDQLEDVPAPNVVNLR